MAPSPSRTPRSSTAPVDARELSEFFAPQRTPSTQLPDPEPFLRNITRGVLEVFAGVREVDQLARWLTEDAYRKLMTRAMSLSRSVTRESRSRSASVSSAARSASHSEAS